MSRGGNKNGPYINLRKALQAEEDFPKTSDYFFDPNFDGMVEKLSEMKLKIRDHLKSIKSRVKATENVLLALEENQIIMKESMKQKAETSDRDISKIISSLGSLLAAIDMHTSGAMKMRSELEQKLFNIQDMVITEISRFEDAWNSKYMQFTSHMANELEVICSILEQNRFRAPTTSELQNRLSERHRPQIGNSRINETSPKSPMTMPKHSPNLKITEKSPSRVQAISDAISGPAPEDTRNLKPQTMHDARSIVSKKLQSKLRSLNIAPGAFKISDSEYRTKSFKLRKELEQMKLGQSKLLHRQINLNTSKPHRSCSSRKHSKKLQKNIPTFLPNFSANGRYLVRHVENIHGTESLPSGNKKNAGKSLDGGGESMVSDHRIDSEKYCKSDVFFHSGDGIESLIHGKSMSQPQIITPTTHNSDISVYLLKNVEMDSLSSAHRGQKMKSQIRKEVERKMEKRISTTSLTSSSDISEFQRVKRMFEKRTPVQEQQQQDTFESDQGDRSSLTHQYTASEEGSNINFTNASHTLLTKTKISAPVLSINEINKTDTFSSYDYDGSLNNLMDEFLKTTKTGKPKQRIMSQKDLRLEKKVIQLLKDREPEDYDRAFLKTPMSLHDAVSAVKCSPTENKQKIVSQA